MLGFRPVRELNDSNEVLVVSCALPEVLVPDRFEPGDAVGLERLLVQGSDDVSRWEIRVRVFLRDCAACGTTILVAEVIIVAVLHEGNLGVVGELDVLLGLSAAGQRLSLAFLEDALGLNRNTKPESDFIVVRLVNGPRHRLLRRDLFDPLVRVDHDGLEAARIDRRRWDRKSNLDRWRRHRKVRRWDVEQFGNPALGSLDDWAELFRTGFDLESRKWLELPGCQRLFRDERA